MDVAEIQRLSDRLKSQISRVVVGQETTAELLFISLLCEGHVLLEGVPGTAKTLLARAFAQCLALDFGRIQFTPDLMPGDVIGTNLFNFQSNEFVLTKGPLFTELLLADEINRTPPKTQAALLQAMQERAVTIDTEHFPLSRGFMVIATQNPIEQQGTYPLPEAQLDRFVFKVLVDYPGLEHEHDIVKAHSVRPGRPLVERLELERVADRLMLERMQETVSTVLLDDSVVHYLVEIVRNTRGHPALEYGASPRAGAMLAAATRAYAVLQGRDYVIPDDVKALAPVCLCHRVVTAADAQIEGLRAEDIIGDILDQVPVPR